MSFRRLASLLLLLPASVTYPQAAPPQPILRLDGSSVSAATAHALADATLKSNNVMGAQLAILNQGRTVWTHTYGLRDAARNLPMTPDTNIWAASITKGVFATWVMNLVAQHRLDLDQPIARMLAHPLNEYEPYRTSAADFVRDPQWQEVTPRMVLAHTSGLGNFAMYEPDQKLHLHFPPGARYAYSGEGLNLLQFAIEERLGQPLDVAMEHDLFLPLGMTRTGMSWRDTFAPDLALRYNAAGAYIGTTHRDHARAAGNMATTINDLSRFTEALLAGKLLDQRTQALMLTPQTTISNAHQFPTLDTTPGKEGPAVGLSYGLGWGLLTHTRFGPAFFKEGHGDGAENYLICFTRTGACMILLTNSDNGELAFRPLLEQLLGDTVTPWEWEGYTREAILQNQEHSPAQ